MSFVGPDVAIDGLVTDLEQAVAAQPTGDLLRAPLLSQQGLDLDPLGGAKAAISPRLLSPTVGVPVGQLRTVAPIVPGRVTPHLPADGASVTTQDAGDGRATNPLASEQSYGVTFFIGDLAIPHHDLLVLGMGKKAKGIPDHRQKHGTACCTYSMNSPHITTHEPGSRPCHTPCRARRAPGLPAGYANVMCTAGAQMD
jgi:hypothetical protein